MSQLIRCQNCSAPMSPRVDGRVHVCAYCGAEVQVAIDGGQLAAGLKLDLKNVDAFLSGLTVALHGALGERTSVQHEGVKVVRFEVNLDPDLFIAKRELHGGVTTQYKKLVRGVALKTATHPLDHWVELLVKALAVHANENARVAQAVAQLRRD